MKFSDTDKMPNHTYEATRREPDKNHITGDAYYNILEFIKELDKNESKEKQLYFNRLDGSGFKIKRISGMRNIEDAFTVKHLVIAKLIAKGYSNKAIMNKIYYSNETIKVVLKDFYKRYEITGNNNRAKRKGLFELLQKKYEAKTL